MPRSVKHLPAIWSFCSSPEFEREVRKINQKVQVANSTLVQVPFDLAHWTKIAADAYPDGLPKPRSSNPTEWLFDGHPKGSDWPLHVAVARLLGYRWPRQTGSSFPECPSIAPDGLEKFADDDGIVCLPPVNREQPAAARLRKLLAAALGSFDERALIAKAGPKGSKSGTLEEWLRDEFFEQHASLFYERPFIWHLWDGRDDGFQALVNYHALDHPTLQKLTYSYLGNWIQQQAEDTKADKPGAAKRLGAARDLQRKLTAILEGEAPLDIFVRWKAIKEQARGWHPDINDGVRQNNRSGAALLHASIFIFQAQRYRTKQTRHRWQTSGLRSLGSPLTCSSTQLLDGHDAHSSRFPPVTGDTAQSHKTSASDSNRVLRPISGQLVLQQLKGLQRNPVPSCLTELQQNCFRQQVLWICHR